MSPPVDLPSPQTHLLHTTLPQHQREYLHAHLGAVFLDENTPRPAVLFTPGVIVLVSERNEGLWVLRAHWQAVDTELPVAKPFWVQTQIESVLAQLPAFP